MLNVGDIYDNKLFLGIKKEINFKTVLTNINKSTLPVTIVTVELEKPRIYKEPIWHGSYEYITLPDEQTIKYFTSKYVSTASISRYKGIIEKRAGKLYNYKDVKLLRAEYKKYLNKILPKIKDIKIGNCFYFSNDLNVFLGYDKSVDMVFYNDKLRSREVYTVERVLKEGEPVYKKYQMDSYFKGYAGEVFTLEDLLKLWKVTD